MTTPVPTIALVMGDAAGVSAELAARLIDAVGSRDTARIIVVGDAGLLAEGARVAGVSLDLPVRRERADLDPQPGRPILYDVGHQGATRIPRGVASAESGAFAMRNFGEALQLGQEGVVDALCFMPFNKQALKLAGNPYRDEIHWAADRLGFTGRCSEYNRLDGLWNARVTSHVPLSEVAGLINREEVVESIADADRTLRAAGTPSPRLAVAGLNPHAGEDGLFGREES